jgi:fucose 4-O-acetylase-like acetyltransferase
MLEFSKPKNYLWLDLLKGIAMIAVVVDHLYAYYQNLLVQYHTGFHVSLFILIAGFTSAISIENRGGVVNFSYVIKRISKIFVPYLFATLFYCLYYRYFDLSIILKKIITFSVAGPLYFVFFYIQLIAISIFIYRLINHQKSKILDIPLLILFYIISYFLNKFKIINSFYGGSGVLFGGSFFFLYVLGLFLKKYENIFNLKKTNIILLITSIIVLTFFEIFNLISISWSNPANNYLIVYTLIVFSLVFSLFQLLLNRFPKILFFITIIGKYSLPVFLYHTLFINIFSKIFNSYLILIPLSIYLPILLVYLKNQISKSLASSHRNIVKP